MTPILVKIFATALALSEVLTTPQAVKTHFDPAQDQAAVVQILRDGCAHMVQAFGVESVNLDELISTALDDPKAVGANAVAFHGINLADLNTAYHQFCKNETVPTPVVDIGAVIDYFNTAATDLPDQTVLKGKKLPSMTTVLDDKGQTFADVFQPGNRRIWVSLDHIPDFVQHAFVSAEDRRFYEHHGVDERGIIRAFIGNLAEPGRPQGGSTITQQVVKNLLVGDDLSYERKIREMIVASRLENTLTKNEILELYLNSAYLGRGSWGVEMAAHSYFGKSAKDLTLAEGAMLAGLLKGPSFYNPDRHPDRARERLAYVVGRMQDDGYITKEQKDQALATFPKLVAFEGLHRDSGFNFVDYLGHEAKADGIASLTAAPYTVHATVNTQLQHDVEADLQEGLARYEIANGRMEFHGPEASLADAVQKLSSNSQPGATPPPWQQALQAVRLPLYDVHWTPAVVVQTGNALRVGLPDGRIVPLVTYTTAIRRGLSLYDVVYVNVVEPKTAAKTAVSSKPKSKTAAPSGGAIAQIRVRPTVQGAVLVLQNKTGRILAMAGGFSYPLSQLNRTAQTERQPGSAIKPITYLTALQKGLQPNTLVPDEPLTFPPIGSGDGRDIIARDYGGNAREQDFWSPHNYGYYSGGVFTLRRGLENSVNLVTAHLLDGGIDSDPEKSLDAICATALAAKIYPSCVRYYPFILGAEPVRMIDLAAFYAAVANGGTRPDPHAVDSIDADGKPVYQYPDKPAPMIGAADAGSFYQLKTMLQGVVARGTARSIGALSPYVGGKTGTTEDSVDCWFVGFTNDVTVAVWVGYDNGDGKRRSLGGNEDGARVALPIFQPIIEDIWAKQIAPKAPLSGPSPEAQRDLVAMPIDYMTGNVINGGGRGNFVEYFRRDANGTVDNTQYQLVSQEDAYASQSDSDGQQPGFFPWNIPEPQGNDGRWSSGGRAYSPNQGWQPQPPQQPVARGFFQQLFGGGPPQPPPAPAPRRDPDSYWGRGYN